MVICKDYQGYYTVEDNDDTLYYVFCALYTGGVPSPLPQDAVGIENFPQNFDLSKVRFAAGSTLFCATSGDIYVADDEGEWQLQ